MWPGPSWALRSARRRRGDRSSEPVVGHLISTEEVAAALGTDASTVRSYAATGYLPRGTDLHGRRYWPRHAVQARIDASDQRHHPERTGAGRQPGDPRNRALAAPAATPKPARRR